MRLFLMVALLAIGFGCDKAPEQANAAAAAQPAKAAEAAKAGGTETVEVELAKKTPPPPAASGEKAPEANKVDGDQAKKAEEQVKAGDAEKPKEGGSDMVTTASGLKYIDKVVGTGKSPTSGRKVKVHYTGKLNDENGQKFDSSVDRGQPFEFVIGMGQVIRGWDEGVAGMKVGGKRYLYIPANLGYGQRGAGGVIPPNAQLWFEVDLLDCE